MKKAEEYLASAEGQPGRRAPYVAAGDAIHAGICAKDAIVTELTGATTKGKTTHLRPKDLRQALGRRPDAASAEKRVRELVSSKPDVECSVTLIPAVKADALVARRSRQWSCMRWRRKR